jgi:hypothetical protein
MNKKKGHLRRFTRAMRAAAFSACLLLLAVSFLSAAFILTNLNHTHHYDGPDGACSTCVHLLAAEQWLRQLSLIVVVSAMALVARFGFFRRAARTAARRARLSPVQLKVRLNN